MGRQRSYDSESETSLSGSPSASDASDSDDSAQQRGRKGEQAEPGETEQNWVLCDSCTKWRRVPAPYANSLDEDAPWYCKLNPNKAFASCSVPQELTDEQIDAGGDSGGESELDEEEGLKRRRIPAVWQLLKDNVLTHRKRKVQDEDDIMICHCKPVWRGGDGCGPDCINRMLCIECVPGFCPSEDKCTNQMFSKRMYANLEIRRAGAKGFGLFALEDIKAGQFIIEYIGEVLEEDEYQRRKEYYMSVGQRHYYFMNIGNGEVIDACRKGNISRFINHSCEPNCETQKWLVHGELAIGLFAVRDIPKDTELTFDYNFERYGDKPMRCYCKSGGCRKFIGGTQDNFDVTLLPAVETVEDATHDWPPIMLGDTDMDPNMRMLLDWRVGTRVDRPKEMGMVTRLERLCKARNVNWTVDYFYNSTFVPVQKQSAQPLILPPELAPAQAAAGKGAGAAQQQTSGGSGKAEKEKPGADSTPAPSTAKSKQQRKTEKVAASTAGKGKASAAKQDKQEADGAAGVAKLQLDDGAAAGPGPGSVAQAMAGTPQFRGPKALFKQWKIMQQQDATPAPAAEEKPAAAPSSPPSPRSPRSQSPSPSQRSGGADAEAGLEDEDAEVEVRAAAAAAAKHAPLRKRLKRLPVKKPPPPPAPALEAQQVNGSAGKALQPHKQSLDRSASPARSSSPPPPGAGRPLDRPTTTGAFGGSSRRGLRSEIDRRLDEVVGATGRLKDPSRQNIIKVLRLFNLCDMGHPNRTFGAAAGGRYLNGGRMGFGDDAGPGPGSSSAGMTARQRARMADLSLLLDVVLKTTSSAAKKEFVTCGLLTQLHQAMGRNTGKEYCVILRKVLRVVEALPLEANDVYAVRSAHGNFADMLRLLSTNADYDVRTKAAALLKKFPPSAVTDQRLLQLMAAPPVRFGGMGRPGMGGMGGMGMGGMGRFPGMMQQQMMQQQMMQQQMLKQQQMMRMKEAQAAAAAAAAAANAGGLPPPPPLGGNAAGSASGEGAAGGPTDPALARTTSTASFGEGDPSEIDGSGGMGGGPMGLPPLGPAAARQRMMAAAAAMGGRPGMMRNMGPVRPGMGPMGMGPGMGMMGNGMGPGGRPGMGMMGMGPMGMGPSPLGLPPRPPSPASAEAYAAYGSGAGDDAGGSAAKRRKYSHTGLDGADASPFGGPLPGPPPRHPYMGGQPGYGSHHGYPGGYYGRDSMDMDREPPGPPPLPPDLPLPPPPPLHSSLYGRSASEERDLLALADLPERLNVDQLFALARPRPRPPALPPLQGTLQPERHLHGQLTDIVALFALGLYGSGNSAWGPKPGATAAEAREVKDSGKVKEEAAGSREKDGSAAAAKDEDKAKADCGEGAAGAAAAAAATASGAEAEATAAAAAAGQGDAASTLSDMTACCCWSPLVAVDGAELAMSPLVETAATGGNEALPPPPPLPLPPGVSGAANGLPLGEGGAPLRPLRTTSAMGLAGAAGPSPYHTNSPAAYGNWDGPAPAGLPTGTNSTNSTPTVSGFGAPGGTHAAGALGGQAAAGGGSALPPVVPISSLSDWRLPGGATDAAGAAAGAAAGGATPVVARASPHASPEHQGAAAGGAAGQEENIDEWLRPVSNSHLEVWEEPDSSFEAYVADMVRHRLGKYMQPEHPSRVSVQEATMLRAKVYREVVAKERRAWEERRSAGVFKPIERHKLESNLKEFVRSTIKRMRDREKEKGGAPAPAAATPAAGPHGSGGHGGHHHSHGSHRHGAGHAAGGGGAAAGHSTTPPPHAAPSAPAAATAMAATPAAAPATAVAVAAGQTPSASLPVASRTASLPPRPSAPPAPEAAEAPAAATAAAKPAEAEPGAAAAETAQRPGEARGGADAAGDQVMGGVEEEPLTPPEETGSGRAAAGGDDVAMAEAS